MEIMTRTPTDTLMAAMEEFGRAEPLDCMIIWTDQSGDICWSSTTDSRVIRLGMIEMVKTLIVKGIED